MNNKKFGDNLQKNHYNLVDFDQVLFDTRDALIRAYTEAFNIHGIDVTQNDLIEMEGHSIHYLFNKLEVPYPLRDLIRVYKKANYKKYFKYIIPNYDLLCLPNKVIVSNAHTEDIKDILNYYHIEDVVGIVGRDQVENPKPAPDPYIKAIREFPALTYTVYEDSDTGIRAASEAYRVMELDERSRIQRVDLVTVELKGGSGQLIRKQGKYIDKVTSSNNMLVVLQQNSILTPKIFFQNQDKIIMEFVDGEMLCERYEHRCHFQEIIKLIEQIKEIPYFSTCLTETYVNRLKTHQSHFYDDNQLVEAFEYCQMSLMDLKPLLDSHISFCHGDLTLSNLILLENKVIVIDPNNDQELLSSWLLDISKLLQSARKYEYTFGISRVDKEEELSKLRTDVYKYVGDNLMLLVSVLELSHWLRLLKYKRKSSLDDFIKAREITIEVYEELKVRCPIQQLF